MSITEKISRKVSHWFHVVSNVRPLVWICGYIISIPIFALIYWWLPDGQFRMPDGAGTGYSSWLYYSIVTITTLGFGDYTPAHSGAQAVTAIEVMCGLLFLGFFLNAVGSMKSEIDVESEIEKQRRLNHDTQQLRLRQSTAPLLRLLHAFVNHGKAIAPDLSGDALTVAVDALMKSAARSSLAIDTFQSRVDLSFWPELLEDCFAFVANYQLLASETGGKPLIDAKTGAVSPQLAAFVETNSALAVKIENSLTKAAISTD